MVRLFILLIIIIHCDKILSQDNLEINADQFTYDKDNTRIFATGNVEIIDNKFKLYADKVFLNNSSKVLSAQENIKIFNSDGTILTANKIVADQSLNNAIMNDNYIYYPSEDLKFGKNYLRLAAKKVERRNTDWEKMDYGIFTACKICFNQETKKNDPPLIQFKAKEIIHDKKQNTVKYYDVFLDVKGNSILYLPYFSHASPTVKRKAGFLAPKIFQTHFFGFGSDVPYYYPFSDYSDITIKPKFSSKKNPSLFLEHRKNFKNGNIRTELSGTVENQTVHQLKKNKQRGHIKTSGFFNLGADTFLDFNVHRTTDRNYLNTYKYGYKDVLESNLKLQKHIKNNFYSLESYAFQDLRKSVNQREVPKIFPRVLINLNSEKKFNQFNFSTNLELSNILKSEGSEMKKIFINQDVSFPFLLKDGTILKLNGYFSAGGYHIEKYDNPVSGNFEYSKYKINYFPQASVEISKPYVKNDKEGFSIITPKVLFVSGNKKAFYRNIPDYTELNFDFDISDLFYRNRFSGNDRFDSNSRVDYGISFFKNSLLNEKDTLIEIGQSYNFERQRYLNKNSGISENFSDIVARLDFNPHSLININTFFSLNKKEYSLRNSITSVQFGSSSSNLSLGNIYSSPVVNDDGETTIEKKNQFSISFNQKIIENWNFTASSTFDKKNKVKFHNLGAKIKYEDECLGLSFSWQRTYTHNPEDPTSNSFMFLFSFKEIMENDL